MQDWRGTFIRLPLIAVIIVIVPGISLVIALILYGQYEYNLDRVRQHLVQDLQLEAALIQDSELSRAIPISTETGSDRLNLRQHFAIRVEPSIAGNSGFDLYYPPGRTHVPVDSISVNRSGMMQALADLTEPDGHFWLSNADGDERSVLVVYRSLPDRPTKILVMDDVSGLRAAYFKALYILVIVLALFLVGGAVLVIWLSTPLIHRLEASEKNYHTLFQSHTEGILLVTMSGMIENCNRQARRMLGAPRRLIIGRHILDFAPEVQPDGVLSRNVLTQQMRPENSAGGRFLLWKIKRYNGTLFDCNLSVKSVPLEGRQVYIVTLQDISRRRAAEEELRRTNRSLKILSESYALLAEAGNESHFLHDICRIIVEHGGYHLAWVALYSSQSDLRPVAQFGSRHGYLESIPLTWQLTSAERDGMFAEVLHTGRPRVFRGWNDLDHSRPTEEDSHSTWRDEVRRSRYRTMIILPLIHEEQRLGVLCILAIDRTAFDLPDHEFLVEVANDIAFAISVLRIRNKHHEADLELRKSEARLARAQELARMGSWEWNLSTNEIYWSDEHFRVLGVKREVFPITYRNILHRIHPEDRNEWRRTLRNLLQGNRTTHYSMRIIQPDGSICHLRGHALVMFGPDWRPEKIIGTTQDITERVLAEQQKQKLLQAIEQSPVSVVITDREARIEYVNPKFSEVTGYTYEEALGNNPRILKSGEKPPEEYAELWETITSGSEWRGEFHNRRKNGELFWEFASISPIKNSQGTITHFVAVKEDITERKLLEEQLQQSQKMEAVGVLAGGVAHDFNNILTIINGYSDLILQQLQPGVPFYDEMKEISRAGGRAAELTRQLLTFSRRQEMRPRVIDFNETIRGLSRLLEHLPGVKFELCMQLCPHTPRIKADPGQVEQIVMNLALNARDAINAKYPHGERPADTAFDGDCLIIRTDTMIIDQDYTRYVNESRPGVFGCLIVEDTGHGIPADSIQHIFEPFYTTKETGKGTGLGLSVVYGIVKQHEGWIELHSEENRGTVMRIFFPTCDQNPAQLFSVDPAYESTSVASKLTAATPPPGVLVLEEDPIHQARATRFLNRYGLRVISCDTEAESYELIMAKARESSVDCILANSSMVDGSLHAYIEKIRAVRPNTAFIYYDYFLQTRRALESADARITFIQMLYSSHTLQDALLRMLPVERWPLKLRTPGPALLQ